MHFSKTENAEAIFDTHALRSNPCQTTKFHSTIFNFDKLCHIKLQGCKKAVFSKKPNPVGFIGFWVFLGLNLGYCKKTQLDGYWDFYGFKGFQLLE